MNEFTSILVTGGTGLLGDELVRQLRGQGYKFVISANSKTFNLLMNGKHLGTLKE